MCSGLKRKGNSKEQWHRARATALKERGKDGVCSCVGYTEVGIVLHEAKSRLRWELKSNLSTRKRLKTKGCDLTDGELYSSVTGISVFHRVPGFFLRSCIHSTFSSLPYSQYCKSYLIGKRKLRLP